MILSKKHKFVFVKGKKVASTSLEVLLSAVCGKEDIITPITPIDDLYRLNKYNKTAQNYGVDRDEQERYISLLLNTSKNDFANINNPRPPYFNHMSFCQITTLYGEIPKEWHVFAIERSPYYKIISGANMQLKFNAYKRTGVAMVNHIEDLKANIDKLIKDKSLIHMINIDLYKDEEGAIRTDLLRYENLNEDAARLMQKLGIKNYPKLQHLKEGMLSNSFDLYDIYSKEQLHIINDVFREEFEYFDYEMLE